MSRNVCITAVDGQTGSLIAELILKNRDFSRKVDSVVGLSLNPQSPRAQELRDMGVSIFHHAPGKERAMVTSLKETGCDTICLIPPAHEEKFDITVELINAAKKADIPNVLFISSAGCDYADPLKQPRLRPQLCAGKELATAASKALGADMEFENISEAEARKLLKTQSDIDSSEQQYLLEYYQLVREGKTNYIATTAFHDVTGNHPTEPESFFDIYADESRPKKKVKRHST
ncbi:hypothetical protein C8034_v001480 [Colletotrichum sidae]|uniref:NmrA-like domain-containing protein n=1 Tax=Colletotrichum sidae TaxID=1347389 RepID=A0A4R8TCR9_9PEZI|nr:hypothetical protein C8034_v001480 [Colletotrichum sidae]